MPDQPIKHSDIIQDGNPFDKTIKGLEELLRLFKKLEKEVKTTAKELLKFSQKQNVATKEGKKNIQSAAKATAQLTEKEKELIRIKKALAREQAKLQLANSQEHKDLIKTREAVKAKNAELRKAAKAMVVGTKNTNKWGKALGSFQFKFNALGNVMANVTSFISRQFRDAIRGAIKTITGFEQAMADVRSITGATGKEFDKLRDSAKQLGGSTKFTAAQVAGLQKEFAKLGFTTDEILGAQAATLDLAAATNVDLAEAAEVAGITVRQFGLTAKETIRVTDVMAKSFSTSALDMTKFREAMKMVGPVAKKAGLSLEETTALLGQLANAGISGSMAGTSLRQILLEMVGTGGDLNEKIATLAKTELTLADASDEVKKRAAAALLVLADGVDDIDDYTEALNNAAGATREMADIQLNTLAGQALIVKSAWQGMILEMATTEDDLEGAKAGLRGVSLFLQAITTALKENIKFSEALNLEIIVAKTINEILEEQAFTMTDLTEGWKGLGKTLTGVGRDIWQQMFPVESGNRVVTELEDISHLLSGLDEVVDKIKFDEDEDWAWDRASESMKKFGVISKETLAAIQSDSDAQTAASIEGTEFSIAALSSLGDATQAFAKDSNALTLTTAIINGIASVIATWKNAGGFPAGIAAAAAQTAIIGSLIARMKGEKFAEGGSGLLDDSGGLLQGRSHSAGGINLGAIGEAERGEYFGIVNRNMSKKYGNELPGIFDSLNNGAFHEVWGRGRTQNNNVVVAHDPNIQRMREIMENTPQIIPDGKRTERYPSGRTRIING